MKLERLHDAVGSVAESERQFIHLEQQVNDFRGGWERFSDVDYKYSPEFGTPFHLKARVVKLGNLSVACANPSDALCEQLVDEDRFIFFHHPDALPLGMETDPDKDIEVTATSSTRTVFTRGLDQNFFIKTSLPKRHFLYDRSMRPHVTLQSVAVSADLEAASAQKSWAFMPETVGAVEDTEGVVFREMAPRAELHRPNVLIPGFSLYSRDHRALNDNSLLSQLIEVYQPQDKLGFMIDKIVGPLQDCWADVLRNRGLLLELHAQNCLFELDENGIGRFVVRDFQSIFSDRDVRDSNGLNQMKIDVFEPDQRAKQYSLCYDHFMGRMFIRHLVNDFMHQYPSYSEAVVKRAIAFRFIQLHSDLTGEMPKVTTFRLAHGPVKINSQPLIETGLPADYR